MSHFVLLRDGTTAATEKYLGNIGTAFISAAGGVVKQTDYVVTSQGTNNLVVSTGRAYVPYQNPVVMMYPTYLDASISSILVPPNNSANTRADLVVLYIDLAASAAPDASLVAKIVDVAGPTDGSHAVPTNAQILTAIGASNPYIILSQVGNASGGFIAPSFTTINSGQITDLRTFVSFITGVTVPVQTYEEFTDQSVPPGAPTSGKTRFFTIGGNLFMRQPTGTPAIQIGSTSILSNGNAGATPQPDWSQGITQAYTLNANASFQTFLNPVGGEKLLLFLKQGASGPYTITWPANNITNGVIWPNGIAPAPSTTVGNVDVYGFIYDNIVSRYRGFAQTGYLL